MNNECITLYIGYAFIFILLIVMTKLYSRESKKRMEAENKHMDLILKTEIEKLYKIEKVD